MSLNPFTLFGLLSSENIPRVDYIIYVTFNFWDRPSLEEFTKTMAKVAPGFTEVYLEEEFNAGLHVYVNTKWDYDKVLSVLKKYDPAAFSEYFHAVVVGDFMYPMYKIEFCTNCESSKGSRNIKRTEDYETAYFEQVCNGCRQPTVIQSDDFTPEQWRKWYDYELAKQQRQAA